MVLTILRSQPGKKTAGKSISVVLGTLPADLGSRGNRPAPSDDGPMTQDALDGVEVTDWTRKRRSAAHVLAVFAGRWSRAWMKTPIQPKPGCARGCHPGDQPHPVSSADDAVEFSKQATGDRVLLRIGGRGGKFLHRGEQPEGEVIPILDVVQCLVFISSGGSVRSHQPGFPKYREPTIQSRIDMQSNQNVFSNIMRFVSCALIAAGALARADEVKPTPAGTWFWVVPAGTTGRTGPTRSP